MLSLLLALSLAVRGQHYVKTPESPALNLRMERGDRLSALNDSPACVPLPEVTNQITYSQAFDVGDWSKIGGGSAAAPSVTADAALAPDGTMTAEVVDFGDTTSGGSYSLLRQQQSVVSSGTYTASVWLRSASGTKTLYAYPADGVTYGSVALTVTTEWTRFSVTKVAGSGSMGPAIGVDRNDGAQSGQPAQSIEVWGAQLETGSDMNRYVPTPTSSAVTSPAVTCP